MPSVIPAAVIAAQGTLPDPIAEYRADGGLAVRYRRRPTASPRPSIGSAQSNASLFGGSRSADSSDTESLVPSPEAPRPGRLARFLRRVRGWLCL